MHDDQIQVGMIGQLPSTQFSKANDGKTQWILELFERISKAAIQFFHRHPKGFFKHNFGDQCQILSGS